MALDAATRLFQQHAQTDAHSGERYMTEEGFVNAIAPTDEDYVSIATNLDTCSIAFSN